MYAGIYGMLWATNNVAAMTVTEGSPHSFPSVLNDTSAYMSGHVGHIC